MTAMTIIDRARIVLIDTIDVAPREITRDSKMSDLANDSLDMIEIAMMLEEEFNIELSDDDTENMQTFGNLVDIVTAKSIALI